MGPAKELKSRAGKKTCGYFSVIVRVPFLLRISQIFLVKSLSYFLRRAWEASERASRVTWTQRIKVWKKVEKYSNIHFGFLHACPVIITRSGELLTFVSHLRVTTKPKCNIFKKIYKFSGCQKLLYFSLELMTKKGNFGQILPENKQIISGLLPIHPFLILRIEISVKLKWKRSENNNISQRLIFQKFQVK